LCYKRPEREHSAKGSRLPEGKKGRVAGIRNQAGCLQDPSSILFNRKAYLTLRKEDLKNE
jgi:hypothetical protein